MASCGSTAGGRYEVCSVCSKQGAKTCSQCKSQFYCSRQCQKSDWKIHKNICKEIVTTLQHQELMPDRGLDLQLPDDQKDRLEMMLTCNNKYKIHFFHREYQKVYPLNEKNFQTLRNAWITIIGNAMAGEKNDLEPTDNKHLLKRWCHYGPRLISFLNKKPNLGDIFRDFPTVGYGEGFTGTIYQSMRNTPCQKLDFIQGQTYISFGFVDMFQLLIGTFKPTQETSGQKPAIFIGYDMSEIVVARNHVLYQMMSDGMDSQSILQVWFSTGWSEKTMEDFQSTCAKLLKQAVPNEKVKELLSYWLNFKISTTAVIPLWTQFLSQRMFVPLPNLEHEVDRVDYAQYLFTGHIFGANKESYIYGNSTLYCLPTNDQTRADENFFYTLSLKNFVYEKSLMTSATKLVSNGLNSLVELIRNGKIICKFFLKDLTVSDKETLTEIRNMDAEIIDWSNIPDYLSNEDFLNMAQACSGPNTVHHLHYMNWIKYVFGASLCDYPEKVETYTVLKRESENDYQHIKKSRPFLSQHKYFQNNLNAADKRLAVKYRKYFLDYVFKGRNVAVSEPTSEEFNPFERANSCFNLSFKFLKK